MPTSFHSPVEIRCHGSVFRWGLELTLGHLETLIGHLRRPIPVVGDEEEREASLAMRLEHYVSHPIRRGAIEPPERLVENEQVRLRGESPRERHTLTLSPAELTGFASREAGGESEPIEPAKRLRFTLGRREVRAEPECLFHGVAGRQARRESLSALLKEELYGGARPAAVELDPAGARLQMSRQTVRQGRLPTPIRPHEGGPAAFGKGGGRRS